MFTSLICGSFHEQELEEDGPLSCGNSHRSIKKSRTKRNSFIRRGSCNKGQSKNSYSRVHLDKFFTLLSDLEEMKNIYLQRDSQDIMFVRFVYSGSEEVVPIIVKSKEMKKNTTEKTDGAKSGEEETKPAASAADVPKQLGKEEKIVEAKNKKVVGGGNRMIAREMNMEKYGRPSYYVPMFVVMILFLLTFFGRSFVILCTSIGWYLVPTLKERISQTTSSSSVVNTNKKTSGR